MNLFQRLANAFKNKDYYANRNVMLDFERETLPWLDRAEADVDSYISELKSLPTDYDLRETLLHWKKFGFAIFPKAADFSLIDTLMLDTKKAIDNHKKYSLMITHVEKGNLNLNQLSQEELLSPHVRFCDFHNLSTAGKYLSLNPTVISFLNHVFRDKVVSMQSLMFLKGSEQSTHQDFPYVVSQIPSHLAASWIALEDIHPDAGPLGYYPGSQILPKFNFGDGMFLTPTSPLREGDFAKFLEDQCRSAGLKEEVFCPKKGDIFVWHAALVHRGTKVNDRSLTRNSFVSHYSTKSAYSKDRRNLQKDPVVYEVNGGYVFGDPNRTNEENLIDTAGPVNISKTW